MQDLRHDKAVEDVLDVLMFEQWMRHYYAVERDGRLFLEIPSEVMDHVRAEYPQLFGLAEQLSGGEISYQRCQEAVCTFVAGNLDGAKYAAEVIGSVFDSRRFKIEQYLFNLWLKGHESYLDAAVRPFAEWREMYANWKKMDEVKDYILKLKAGVSSAAQTSTTVH